jgi:Ca-activated chloride channel homolog
VTNRRAATQRRLRVPRRTRAALSLQAGFFFSLACALTLPHQLCTPRASAQDESDEVVRVRTDLVTIPLYVTDASGRRVPGLAPTDFEVLDEGKPVEPAYFGAGDERVSLLFLLDGSGSTREIIGEQRETALALFTRFGPRSRVAVIQFRERPELALPFTAELRRARAAFQIAALPDRRTAIFDAALAAVRAFADAMQQPNERRIVVLLSDGLDTASETRADSAINEARAAGVSFYVIHVPLFEPSGGHLVMRRPSKGFRELAEKTGGRYFVVGDARTSLDPHAEPDLRPIFQAVADDLAGQYVLGYHASAAPQPGFHRVEVRLKASDKRKLRVRQLRDGYENKGGDK